MTRPPKTAIKFNLEQRVEERQVIAIYLATIPFPCHLPVLLGH